MLPFLGDQRRGGVEAEANAHGALGGGSIIVLMPAMALHVTFSQYIRAIPSCGAALRETGGGLVFASRWIRWPVPGCNWVHS